MLEIDLRNYLLEQESVTDLIGNRFYPGWIPKNAVMPSVAFFIVSGSRYHDIDIAYPRVQMSIFSKRYLEAKKIASNIINCLRRFKGIMGDTKIIQIVFENEHDMFESDTEIHHIAVDFKIIYRE